MTPQRTVVVLTTLSLLIFAAAGGRVETLVAKLRGAKPPAPTKPATVQNLVGFGFLFVTLTIMADFPATGKLAQGFASLITLAIAITYGPAAFDNITKLVGGESGPTGGGSAIPDTRMGGTPPPRRYPYSHGYLES